GLRLPLSLIETALATMPTADAAAGLVHFRDAGEGTWTNMPMQDGRGRTMFLLVAGDQVTSGLADWLLALSSMALRAAGARVDEQHIRRLCLDTYAASRRMARVA